MAEDRLDDARSALAEALSRKLDDSALRERLYILSFLEGNGSEMATHVAWFDARASVRHQGLALEAETEAYSGHFRKPAS
jgi:hypothetical protein